MRAYLNSILLFLALSVLSFDALPSGDIPAGRFVDLALACVHQEYPNKIAHVMSGDEDIGPPRVLTPVFYGCFDWHSAVHGHWLLVRLLRLNPDADFAADIETALERSFQVESVSEEVRYFQHEQRASFERPYGIAWFLQLMTELREWDDPRAHHWQQTLEPLEAVLVDKTTSWLNKLAYPILVGRPAVVESRIDKLGLRLKQGEDFELVNPESDPRFWDYWTTYHAIMERNGVSADTAKTIVRTRNSVIAALMLYRNEADALITGVVGRYRVNLKNVLDVIGLRPGARVAGSLGALSTDKGAIFVCDTHVNADPSVEEIVEVTLMAAEKIRIFGIHPRVALLSHSAFGSHDDESAGKMKKALHLLRQRDPDMEVEGEMTADMALDENYRRLVFPNSRLSGQANLMVMPNLDSAHIAFNMARIISNSVTVGPMLLGMGRPAHVLTPSASARRIVNMTAIAVVEAQLYQQQNQENTGTGVPA